MYHLLFAQSNIVQNNNLTTFLPAVNKKDHIYSPSQELELLDIAPYDYL